MGQPELCIGNLASLLLDLSAQLVCDFVNLADACRTNRMALRLQSSARVDRYPSADVCLTLLDHGPTLTLLAEPKVLVSHDLGDRETIVNFSQADVLGL